MKGTSHRGSNLDLASRSKARAMGSPASHYLERCDGGRDYHFRSPQTLHALLGLSPPYRRCLAYAPFAKKAPDCSRPVNRAKADSVDSLLCSLRKARVPSPAAEALLKTLSTHAVCGITDWHQNKAVDVYSGWQREIREECLRLNGLDQRQWGKPAPSMPGWENRLSLARQQQGWETEESEEDDIVSLSGRSATDSDVPSDSDGQDISSDIEEDGSSSEEIVLIFNASFSDSDGDSPNFYTSTSSQCLSTSHGSQDSLNLRTDSQETSSHGSVPASPTSAYDSTTDTESALDSVDEPPATSAGDAATASDESEVQEEGGSSDTDEFATHLSDIDVNIFQNPDAATCSASVPGILSPRPPASASPPAGFRRYPQAPSPASQLKELLNLMTQTVSQHRRYTGVLYGFARPSAPGMFKIGVVKDRVVARRPFADPVDHRLATWQAQCGHPVVEVFRKPIACTAAERIERLVHHALREYRRVEDPPCERCERRKRASNARTGGGRCSGGQHNEWFEVDVKTALRAVNLWAAFAEQQPYDRFGRLLDFWSAKAEAGIRPGDTVKSWQEEIPRLVEECTRTGLEDVISRLYI